MPRELVPGNVDGLMHIRDYRIDHDNAFHDDVSPTAVSMADMIDMGLAEPLIDNEHEILTTCTISHEMPTCTIHIHKAKIPLSRRKEFIDEDDMAFTSGYRCRTCEQCPCKKKTPREKMMSIQEKVEQEAIIKSISINTDEKKTYADLPFTKDPVQALKKKHHGKESNYYQALRIYKNQCKKPAALKEEMKKVHADLVNRGFMTKLSDLDGNKQEIIRKAGFNHYMPWQGVVKPGSKSTPYRMVVDATITGINEILAKGINNLGKTTDILLRNRCREYIWSSDVTKMYNQLHLEDSALPYGLFLFDDELDETREPTIYVMLVAWYGVTPTSNQSGEALERLATMHEDSHH